MLKNISSIALVGTMLMSTACILTIADDATTSDSDDPTTEATETGDGDGDPTTGDGDGDGDPTTGGDGDGDPTTGGDGDGDPTTGGGGMCGWNADQAFYGCGFEGEDPAGNFPIACPDGLVEGDACDVTGLTGEGCCDADGNNWYCGDDGGNLIVVFEACGG